LFRSSDGTRREERIVVAEGTHAASRFINIGKPLAAWIALVPAELVSVRPIGTKMTAGAWLGIVNLDRVLLENKAGFEADLAANGTEIKLIVRRGASEKRFDGSVGRRARACPRGGGEGRLTSPASSRAFSAGAPAARLVTITPCGLSMLAPLRAWVIGA